MTCCFCFKGSDDELEVCCETGIDTFCPRSTTCPCCAPMVMRLAKGIFCCDWPTPTPKRNSAVKAQEGPSPSKNHSPVDKNGAGQKQYSLETMTMPQPKVSNDQELQELPPVSDRESDVSRFNKQETSRTDPSGTAPSRQLSRHERDRSIESIEWLSTLASASIPQA